MAILTRGAAFPRTIPAARAREGIRTVFASTEIVELVPLVAFVVSLGVYAYTRLEALDAFPIYFFTDEAIHPVLGAALVHNRLRDAAGNLLPPYFQNGPYWNLSLSVYIHALTASLFGQAIVVTRGTSALLSIIGVASVGLMMRVIFKIRTWWIVVLVLTATPAWFLHSRTAFETAMMVSFYACFLLCYLLYRFRSPLYLFPALLFAAMTFYSYASGQPIIVGSVLLLALSDLRYHLQERRIVAVGLILGLLLALPYVRFRVAHPGTMYDQLRILNSYWTEPIPLGEKLRHFVGEYLYGLSPQYWFFPNTQDLVRHRMVGYSNISVWLLPFFLLGLGVSLRNIRSSAHRAVLVSLVAAPLGSALVQVGITRALVFVLPAAILATLGWDAISAWLAVRRWWLPTAAVSLWLAGFSLWMTNDALAQGPFWSTDYGLYGMQWGAKQLFAQEIPAYMRLHPVGTIYVSGNWANGSNVFFSYFDMPPRVQPGSVGTWITEKQPLTNDMTFVMAPDEYALARGSRLFKSVAIDHVVPWPDGQPGFYFVHLAYVDNVGAVFRRLRAAQLRPVTDRLRIDGQMVVVRHTRFDMGRASSMFDGDTFTVARGIDVNPLVLDFTFSRPRRLATITGDFGGASMVLTATVTNPHGMRIYRVHHVGPDDAARQSRSVVLLLKGAPQHVSRLRLVVRYARQPADAHVHVYELRFG